jgi:cell division protease FtsH
MPFLGREMSNEPDYSEEVAREIDDEVRRIIEDGHELALKVLREHIDGLHRISQILIERETIDKDQFERLVAGDAEEDVFAELDSEEKAPPPVAEPERRPQPTKPRPFPLPGSAATMKPPEPEGVN